MLEREKLLQLRNYVHLLEIDGNCYVFATRANRIFQLAPEEIGALKLLLADDAASLDTASFLTQGEMELLEKLYQACVIEPPPGQEPELSSLVLLVSEACNFACTYCYGSYGVHTKKMSIETAVHAIDLAWKLGIRDVVFFGGEPLTNFPVIQQAVEHIEKSGYNAITLRMTTNGSLVTDDIAEFLREHRFQVSVSMDGDQLSHDLTRIYHDQSSTYANVIQGINRLKKYNVLSLLEVTYSARHPDLGKQLRAALDLFPVVSCACVDGGQESSQSADVISGDRFRDFYHVLLDTEHNLGENELLIGARELYDRICNGEPLVMPKYLCSDIGTRLIVSADGQAVPCPEMTSRSEYTICNMNTVSSPLQFLELRTQVLERLSSKRLEQKWFTGLCETCIQHVKEKDGRFIYQDEDSFQSCVDSLLARFLREYHV